MSEKVSERTGINVNKVAGVIAGGVYLGNKVKKGYDLANAGFRIVGTGIEGEGMMTATAGAGESIITNTAANIAGEALISAGELAGGVDLLGSAGALGVMTGIGGAMLPALGVGLLAYELFDLLWSYIMFL